jgi:hypothetical protein
MSIIAGKLLGVPQLSRALVFGGTALWVALQTLGDEGSLPTTSSDRAPRIYAKEPDEAVRTFSVPAGFRMELIAAEPLITDGSVG